MRIFVKAMETLSTTKGRVALVAKVVEEAPVVPAASNQFISDDSDEESLDLAFHMVESDSDSDYDEEEEAALLFFEEKQITYEDHKAILQGRRIDNLIFKDLAQDVPLEIIEEVRAMLTTKQRDLLFGFIHRVPMGFMIILGPAGTGKSFVLAGIIMLLIAAGKKVSVIAPSNIAAINIANKSKSADQHDRLLVRPSSSCEEENAVIRYDVSDPEAWKAFNDGNEWVGHERWLPDMSVAELVLMMCGRLPTTSAKLLNLAPEHTELARILAIPTDQREPGDQSDLRRFIRAAAKDIMKVADAAFTTSAAALSDMVKAFTKHSDATVVEEAGNAVEAEVINSWRGDGKDLILVGDPKQLPPAALSKNVRHPPSIGPLSSPLGGLQSSSNALTAAKGRAANPFNLRLQTSSMERYMTLGWLIRVFNEEIRMVSGGFDPASRIIYSDKNITDGPYSSFDFHLLFQEYQDWAFGLSSQIKPSNPANRNPALKRLLPILVDLKGSVVEIDPITESRRNPQSARASVLCVKSLLTKIKGLQHKHIATITPYRHQLKLIRMLLREMGLE
jgi:AAA domain